MARKGTQDGRREERMRRILEEWKMDAEEQRVQIERELEERECITNGIC